MSFFVCVFFFLFFCLKHRCISEILALGTTRYSTCTAARLETIECCGYYQPGFRIEFPSAGNEKCCSQFIALVFSTILKESSMWPLLQVTRMIDNESSKNYYLLTEQSHIITANRLILYQRGIDLDCPCLDI